MADSTSIVPIEQFGPAELTDLWCQYNEKANEIEGRDSLAQGVYSSFSPGTPKYLRRISGRHHEFEGTTARMMLQLPSGTFPKIYQEIDDTITRQIFAKLADDGTRMGGIGYIDFILSNVSHGLEEKIQVSETLSDNYTSFFFGHRPPVFQYAGFLMNTFQDDWTMQMLRLFRDLGRGTALARRGLLMHLKYDSMIVSGAMLDFKWIHNGQIESSDSFSFGFLVKRINIIYGGIGSVTDIDGITSEKADDLSFFPEGVQTSDIESTYSYVQLPATDASRSTRPKGTKKYKLVAVETKTNEPLCCVNPNAPVSTRANQEYRENNELYSREVASRSSRDDSPRFSKMPVQL